MKNHVNRLQDLGYTVELKKAELPDPEKRMIQQGKGRLLLVVTTPYRKLTWPGVRTKECCHEHAGEIFITTSRASC